MLFGDFYNYDDQPLIRVYPGKVSGPDIIRNLPLYEYEKDDTGLFLQQFTDSLLTIDPMCSIYYITPSKGADFRYANILKDKIKLPDDGILIFATYWFFGNLEKAKGVIRTSKNKLGVIFDDNTQWLEQLHLRPTGDIMTVMYGKDFPEPYPVWHFTNELDAWAVVRLNDDGQVRPVMIYNMTRPIDDFPRWSNKFDWITTSTTK